MMIDQELFRELTVVVLNPLRLTKSRNPSESVLWYTAVVNSVSVKSALAQGVV